jgi:hypothetical protein
MIAYYNVLVILICISHNKSQFAIHTEPERVGFFAGE